MTNEYPDATPGPWHVTGRGIFAGDLHIATTTHPQDIEQHPEGRYPDYDTSLANARLIAAARNRYEHINAWSVRWVEHDPTCKSLMVGRVELAQICRGRVTQDWFYTLRFCVDGEVPSYSCLTEDAAKSVAEGHATKVLSGATEETITTMESVPQPILFSRRRPSGGC